MAKDGNGWNQLTRNNNGFKTDNFNVGNGISVHDTINVNSNGDITKPHTTIDFGNQSIRINQNGTTNLKK